MPIWTPLISLLAAGTASTAVSSGGPEQCEAVDPKADLPCVVAQAFSPVTVTALMRDRDRVWWTNGDRLTVLGRLNERGEARLCCAIQAPLKRIGDTQLGAITLRIPRMDQAMLDVVLLSGPVFEPPEPLRGIDAPPAPAVSEVPQARLFSRSVSSTALNGEREVTIYLPTGIGEGRRVPVIYLADGESARGYAGIFEAALAKGEVEPAMIVGIHSAKGVEPNCHAAHCDRRNLEYIPDSHGVDARHFTNHLRFVADELIPYIERRYPASRRREDRIVAGFSSGAVWAFSAAAIRSDVFGGVLGMSSGSGSTVSLASGIGNARIYAGAGLFEPKFLDATSRRVELARAAGSEAEFTSHVSGHSSIMWDVLFHEGASWLLPSVEVRTARRSASSPSDNVERPATTSASLPSAYRPTSQKAVGQSRSFQPYER
ncbi:MAG: alpha/beta hydrolase-fold protein [Allosphingosinicella sp.]